jgi:hypothetical protein
VEGYSPNATLYLRYISRAESGAELGSHPSDDNASVSSDEYSAGSEAHVPAGSANAPSERSRPLIGGEAEARRPIAVQSSAQDGGVSPASEHQPRSEQAPTSDLEVGDVNPAQ